MLTNAKLMGRLLWVAIVLVWGLLFIMFKGSYPCTIVGRSVADCLRSAGLSTTLYILGGLTSIVFLIHLFLTVLCLLEKSLWEGKARPILLTSLLGTVAFCIPVFYFVEMCSVWPDFHNSICYNHNEYLFLDLFPALLLWLTGVFKNRVSVKNHLLSLQQASGLIVVVSLLALHKVFVLTLLKPCCFDGCGAI